MKNLKRLFSIATFLLLVACSAQTFNEGVKAFNEGDDSKALEKYFPLAVKGDAGAQNNLGVMYAEGRGVKKTLAKAKYWYEKSANQGNSNAQSNLGWMYYRGKGVKKDFSKSLYWFERAARQGNGSAFNGLGVSYYFGHGVTENKSLAYKYWKATIKTYQQDDDPDNDEYIKNLQTSILLLCKESPSSCR